MNIKKYVGLCLSILLLVSACKEGDRFNLSSDDTTPPSPPTNVTATPLNGAIRLHFTAPKDEDLMSIEAKCGENTFAVSFYVDSLDVMGLAETKAYTISVYAVDKAGNRSTSVDVQATPLESAISKITESFKVLPGFGAFIVDWENELEETVNVFIEYSFVLQGQERNELAVFSSRSVAGRAMVNDLDLNENDLVSVKVSVGDRFNNRGAIKDKGSFKLLYDEEINHFDASGNNLWSYPPENQEPPFGGGVKQMFGNAFDGMTSRFIDGIIDDKPADYNYFFAEGNPYNYLIDLGDYYELSRVIIHPRHSGDGPVKGGYFSNDIGIFATYRWDEETDEWEPIGTHKTLMPEGMLSDLQWYKLGIAGHMHYLYADNPHFSKPTRWFRFEGLKGFDGNYTAGPPACLSEIRLFSKHK
jgi:hypothetical protein